MKTPSCSAVRPGRTTRGFGLLEAIVALALMSSVGLALFAWANNTRQTLLRVQDATVRQEAIAEALEFMKLVNPMQRPQGETSLGPLRVSWNAQAIAPRTTGAAFPEGASLYDLALYRVQVTVGRTGEPEWVRFEIKQVGYVRARDPIQFVPG